MDSFIKTLCICLFIFVMTITVPPVVEFIKATSEKNGDMGTASYYTISESNIGYSLSYNLDGGTLTKENLKQYGLFTPTFTLNNPSKIGYEFIGWTGSNGDIPQLTITICTGSCGDLEFTANYKQILQLLIDENAVTWTEVEGVTSFDIYVNNTKCLTTTNRILSIEELNSFCNNGQNVVYIKSGELISNTIDYVYYDTSILENVVLNVKFSRSSEGYSLNAGNLVIVAYTYNGQPNGGMIDNNVYE